MTNKKPSLDEFLMQRRGQKSTSAASTAATRTSREAAPIRDKKPSLDEFLASRRQRPNDTMQGRGKEPLLTEYLTHRNVVQREKSNVRDEMKRTLNRLVNQMGGGLDGEVYQQKLQRALDSGKSIDQWFEEAERNVAAAGKTGSERHRGDGFSGRSGKFGMDLDDAQRDIQYATVAKQQQDECNARKRAQDAGLSPEDWYQQANAAVEAEDERTAKAEKGSFWQSVSEAVNQGNIVSYAAAREEGEPIKAELDAARGDRTMAMKDLEYARRAYWDSIPERADFAEGVARGKADPDNKVEDAIQNKEKYAGATNHGSSMGAHIRNELRKLSHLSEDEQQIYNYLLGTKGRGAAEEYLSDMTETINYRDGKRIADEIEQKEGAWRVASELWLATQAGIESAGTGLAQNIFRDDLPTSATAFASQETRKNIEQHDGPELLGHSVEGIAYDATNTMANMAPSLAIGTFNPIAGAAVMGAQSKGQAYQQALKQGYTRGQAEQYSVAVGAAEAGLSYVLGGISQMGGISQFTGKMTQRIGNGWLRAGVELGIDVLGENTEEYLQNKLEPLLRNTIFGEDNEIRLWDEEDAYTVLLTTMTTGLLNAGNTVSTAQIGKVGQQFQRNGQVDKLLELAQNFDAASEVQELAAAMQRGETPKNAMNIGELAVAFDRAGGDMSALIHTERAEEAAQRTEQAEGAPEQVVTKTARTGDQRAAQREFDAERADLPQPIREELERNAANLGEDTRIVMAAYHAGQDINHYVAAMDAAINLYAANNISMEKMQESALTKDLTQDQIEVAYEVGRGKYERRIERAKEQQAKAEVQNIQPGRVRYDGAIIDGKEYGGVKRQNMSRAQRTQVEASAVVAKALGLELNVYYGSRDGGVQGAYQSGRVIYLNVNAGQEVGETLIVNAFSHELTHFTEEYGGEAYESLRSYVIDTLAEGNMERFEQIVTAKMESQGLDYDRAISEVVADGCEMMLRDSAAPALLAERNPTLANQIARWISEWVEKIKAAFQGVNARHEEARMLLDSAQELQKLWDSAITAAVENSEAQKTAEAEDNKKTAEAGGEVQYSIAYTNDNRPVVVVDEDILSGVAQGDWIDTVKDVMKNRFGSGIPVAGKLIKVNLITRNEYTNSRNTRHYAKNNRTIYKDKLKASGKLDEIILASTNYVNEDLKHERKDNIVEFARGDVLMRIGDNGYTAKVIVGLTSGKSMVLYDVIDFLPATDIETVGLRSPSKGKKPKNSSNKPTNKNIPQSETDVNTQHSESEGSVTDRQLLREAAEREGASDILRGYKKKADNLDMYQRRLERQREKLESSELSDGERAAVRERMAETERLLENTQRAMQQMERRPDMQHIAKEERARWWSENMGDAVETSRRLQKENTELKEAVDYYREQAKRTAPENRRVDAADVRRFARALVKEHGSSADVKELSAKIQKIGDMLVSADGGTGLSDRRLRQEARAAARMVIDEVYRDANEDNAPMRREIAERVRGTRLQISDELRGDMTDFNQWRKSQLGRFTLVKEDGRAIDSFYEELSVDFGEGLFPRNITAQADQLQQIQQVLDSLAPDSRYAFSEYGREAMIGIVSEEILDTIISGDIRQAETMADRNYRTMQAQMLEAKESRLAAEKAAERTARRADNAERTALRQVREEQAAITREKVKRMRQELNESREAQQKRINIERSRSRLSRMLRENSKTKHLPEALRGEIGKLLLSIDTLGPFSEGTKSEARYRDELQQIQQTMQNIAVSSDLAEVYGDMELTDGVKVMLQNNVDTVKAAIGEGGEMVTRKMGLKELRALEETLTVIETACRNMNELLTDGEHRFAQMDQMAEHTIAENAEIEERKTKSGEFARQLKWANLTPYYAFKRFGEAGQEVFRGLSRGWGKMARHIDQVQRFAEKAYTGEEAKAWESTVHKFELQRRTKAEDIDKLQSAVKTGGPIKNDLATVEMTEAQIMSLYCLNKRDQARGHLYGAGIRVGDFIAEGRRTTTTQAENFFLDLDDMAKITSVLSERQIEVCDKLMEYMNTVGSAWGNEVSMKLYGINGFTEKNYFPIKTDSTQHDAKTEDSKRGNLYRLANQSFTKQTVRDAKNAIMLDSIFDVWSDHMADMAKYNALVLPMLDTMRWYNYQAETTSVQQSLERALGKDAGRYIMDFMQDMNGAGEGGRGEQAFSKLMSGVKVAAVGANIRVALQQPTSIARAALLINPKYLLNGARMKDGRAKALQHSGLALWKDLGYFDVNVNRGMREQIKHVDTIKDKIQDKSLWLAEKGDQITWGALWNACELETKDKTGLTGEALMQKTAERFDEVILATQVMDSTLTRSDNMRSKSLMLKEFTAFMAEPTLTYNMLLDCYSEFDKLKRKKGTGYAVQQMKGQILRAGAVYSMSAALTAVAQAAADAGRDDDDYETWAQKFLQHWSEDFLDNLNPMKLVPIMQDLYNIVIEKRDKNLLVLQPIQQAVQVFNIWSEWYKLQTGQIDKATKTTYYGNMTMWGQIYKTLQVFSSATGLPLGAATREFQAGYNTFLLPMLNETYGKFSGKELKKWRTYDAGPARQIKSAWESGYLNDEAAKEMLIKEGEAKDDIEAGKIIYGWQIDGAAAYKAVKAAACSGDDKGYREALEAMTAAGYAESDVYTEVKKELKVQYQQPEIGLKLSKAYCIDYLMKYAGMGKTEAEKQAQEWTCYVVTGIDYEDIKQVYIDGDITKSRAQELRQKYGGYREAEAAATVLEWQCKKDTGIDYKDIKQVYIDGDITKSRAQELRQKYGGYTEEKAKSWADQQEFIKAHPDFGDISESAVEEFNTYANPAKISAEAYYQFWISTKGSQKEAVIAYIDALRITPEQKDALYYAKGYAESNIKKTPWHA